ncbi:MAG TPA: M67 family metallopeptidase [Anaerolineales bacterium]|nr:M67 family metallopeptidase [Anaerolineales bacterium]
MTIAISAEVLRQIHAHGEQAYPEEGAGLLLGRRAGGRKQVVQILGLANTREDGSRRNRYLLSPQDYLWGEEQAEQSGLEVLGVFHSHPDHPNLPSEYDLEWAWPSFFYVITSLRAGQAIDSRAWLLADDRSGFEEEPIEVYQAQT